MPNVRVKILDVSGSRASEVEAPDDVAINRILVLLVEKMNLPLNSPDGQIMSYKLHHRRTGKQLLDSQTLSQAFVQAGDELRLQPEITAGGRPSALDGVAAPVYSGGASRAACPTLRNGVNGFVYSGEAGRDA